MRMTIALNDLRGGRRRLQVQLAHHFLLSIRRKMRESADRAGELSYAHGFDCFLESSLLASNFVVEQRQLQSKCRWFRMNPVSPADDHGGLEFMRAFLQNIEQPLNIFENDGGGLSHLKSHGRVEDIRRRKAEMKITRRRPDIFRHRLSKGDHVVLHFRFYFI